MQDSDGEKWIDGVRVFNEGGYCDEEIKHYIEMAQDKAQDDIQEITLTPHGEQVEINYVSSQRKFERIRRITGYLVGTIDRWNNAKKAEERDRVKHD